MFAVNAVFFNANDLPSRPSAIRQVKEVSLIIHLPATIVKPCCDKLHMDIGDGW